ncbi:MAG: ACT domain-containing protein [Solobacterium sp.]|nr:ACT domain-containing protein [Solobacterium sp.]
MSSDFYIVHKNILPDYLDKVIYARNLLSNHEVNTVTEAVQKAGISRNTYYKYKDFVYEQNNMSNTRHAVITLILKDESGSLSSVINTLSQYRTSILTISQAIPIDHKANVLISLDITNMSCTIQELILQLKELPMVRKIQLDGVK